MQAARSEPSEGRRPIRDRLQIFQWRNRLAATAAERQKFLWIIKADIKDLHVPKGRRFVPLPEIISDLVQAGVSVRLMHAEEPGPRFREDFDRYPNLVSSDLFERILCPRIHTKAIIMDGRQAFIGSANLTGAGLGAKGAHKRNFEAGFLTTDGGHLLEIMDWIDQLYLGELCLKCQRRSVCPDPVASSRHAKRFSHRPLPLNGEDVRAVQFFIGQRKSKQPFTDRFVSSFRSEEQGSERTGSGRGRGQSASFLIRASTGVVPWSWSFLTGSRPFPRGKPRFPPLD